MVNGLIVKEFSGDDLLDDLLLDLLAKLLGGDGLSVLGRDNDSVDTERNNGTAVVGVLNGDLSLGIRAQPGDGTVLAGIGHGRIELVGEEDGQGEEFRGLISGIAKHDTLVTSTKVFEGLFVMETLGDIGRLLLDGNEDIAGLVVEALVGRVVANLLDGIADNLLVVEAGLGGNLTKDHDHTGLSGSLACDLGERVLLEAGIENGV